VRPTHPNSIPRLHMCGYIYLDLIQVIQVVRLVEIRLKMNLPQKVQAQAYPGITQLCVSQHTMCRLGKSHP
jgi:hypothetical protein